MGGADAVGVVWLRRGSSEDKTKQNESRYQKTKASQKLPHSATPPTTNKDTPIESMIQWYKKESGNHGGGELGGGAGVGRGRREGAKWQLEKKKKKGGVGGEHSHRKHTLSVVELKGTATTRR